MSQQAIAVQCQPIGDGWTCSVRVGDDPGASRHQVNVSRADMDRFAPLAEEPSALVELSFRFLLEREPREAIMTRFDLPVIERYFPDYPTEIRQTMEAGD